MYPYTVHFCFCIVTGAVVGVLRRANRGCASFLRCLPQNMEIPQMAGNADLNHADIVSENASYVKSAAGRPRITIAISTRNRAKYRLFDGLCHNSHRFHAGNLRQLVDFQFETTKAKRV